MLQELLEMLQTLIGHGPFYRVYNQCRDRQKVLCWMVVKEFRRKEFGTAPLPGRVTWVWRD